MNRPNADERGILLGFEARLAAGQSMRLLRTDRIVELQGRRHILFMQAIPTFDSCLICHGAALDPAVDRAVRELYPEDEATGYAVGDIRGAFVLYKPLPENGEPSGPAPVAARPRPLLERLGYSPKKRAGAVGDAAAGADTFERGCQHCHAPNDLARHLFSPGATTDENAVCRFLGKHGASDEQSACDIVAFLQDLALFLVETGQ